MPTLQGSINNRAWAGENVFLTEVGQGLTVKDIIDDILNSCWGIQVPSLAYKYQIKRAIHDMNAAYQLIWGTAKDADYFSRETLELTIPAGMSQLVLTDDVFGVLGPCRLASTKQPLRPLSSRSQYDSYGPIFMGLFTFTVPNGVPQAFFIERLNVKQPDNVQNVIHVVPAPSGNTDILLDVSNQCPRYVWNDYVNATPVQMPNKYADSVLISIARYYAMSSHYFIDEDRRPTIVEAYQTALKIIGAVDPAMKEVTFAERASDRSK